MYISNIDIKPIVLLILIALTYNCLYAQAVNMPDKEIAPPEAAAFLKQVNFPNSGYSGKPDITIPLFSKKFHDITYNINLSYNYNGLIVNEEATSVGLGWTLNYGGMLTQTIMDKIDQEPYDNESIQTIAFINKYGEFVKTETAMPFNRSLLDGQLYQCPSLPLVPICINPNSYIPHNTTGSLPNGLNLCVPSSINTQADIYTFSFNGYSGKFLSKKFDGTGGYMTLDNSKFKITYNKEITSSNITEQFIIISPDGVKAVFEYQGHGTSSNSNPYTTRIFALKELLKNKEKISFTYTYNSYRTTNVANSVHTGLNSNYWIFPQPKHGSTHPTLEKTNFIDNSTNYFREPLIQEIYIHSSDTRILFDYIDDRKDIHFYPNGLGKKLNSMKVISNNNLVHNYRFEYSYFGDTINQAQLNSRLKLKRIIKQQVTKSSDCNSTFNNCVSQADDERRAAISDCLTIQDEEIRQICIQNAQNTFLFQVNQCEQNYQICIEGETLNDEGIVLYSFNYIGEDLPHLFPSKLSYARDHWGYFNGKSGNTSLIPPGYVNEFTNIRGERTPDIQYSNLGLLSKIKFPTGGVEDLFYEANTTTDNQIGPGWRIFEIEKLDIDGSTKLKQRYIYDGGKLLLPNITYFEPINLNVIFYSAIFLDDFGETIHGDNIHTINYGKLYSNSIYPIFDNNSGSALGYDQVSVYNIIDDEEVWEKTTFYENDHIYVHQEPHLPLSNKSNNGRVLAINTINNLISYQYQDSIIDTLWFAIKKGHPYSSESNDQPNDNCYNTIWSFYPIFINESKLIKNIESLDGNTTITKFFYDNNKIDKPTRVVTYNTDEKIMKKTKYPSDYATYDAIDPNAKAIKKLYEDNNLHAPIEIIEMFYNENQNSYLITAANLFLYKIGSLNQNTNIIEVKDLIIDTSIPENEFEYSSIQNGVFHFTNNYISNIILDYDLNGNIVETREKGEDVSAFIWGYNNYYLVGIVENASYLNLTENLKNLILDLENYTFLESIEDRNALISLNENIRNLAPENSLLKTCTYIPEIGISSITDIRGRTKFFEYDEYGRLIKIRDHDHKILEEYQYHYSEPDE